MEYRKNYQNCVNGSIIDREKIKKLSPIIMIDHNSRLEKLSKLPSSKSQNGSREKSSKRQVAGS